MFVGDYVSAILWQGLNVCNFRLSNDLHPYLESLINEVVLESTAINLIRGHRKVLICAQLWAQLYLVVIFGFKK